MFLKIIIAILFLSMTIFAQTQPPIETGVSQKLAKWRAANYSNVRYRLNITLEKGAPLMRGDIEIRVNLTEEGAKNDLILDWRTTQFANDKDKPFANVVAVNEANATGAQAGTLAMSAEREKNVGASETPTKTLQLLQNEHIAIPKSLLKTGENIIKINFASPIKTSGAAITRYVDKEDNAEYIYSLFVPSDASTAFPVFDQPDLKAKFSLEIITPKDWKAVSNTNGIGYIKDDTQHYATYSFPETKPISTYVFAFAAGDFQIFEDKSARIKEVYDTTKIYADAILPKIYVRKSQAEKFKQHAAEVFRLNREGVKFLEDWFDYKFPFPKYDLVLIPEFPFGGMEHAGATFLREDRVIFPTEPTKNDFVTRANVIFHEAAHQWFGDTVTMRWFDDLWLKEGFAEFMAYKTLAKVIPEYNAWKVFYERNKQAAYLTDATRGTTPIYQEIPNLSSAKSAYGNIVYRKAPSFLRQAEFYLGEDKFQTAVRAFLKKHEFANAEWTDLVKEFEKSSERNLKNWSENWVTKRGLPIFSFYEGKGDKDYTMLIHGKRLYPFAQVNSLNEKNDWQEKLKILVIFQDGTKKTINNEITKSKPVDELEATQDSLLIPFGKDVAFKFLNYEDYGYGIFLLDEKSRAYVLENIQTEKDDFLRSMMWGSLWDSVRFYELAPEDYVKLVIKNINIETDESTIATLLNRTSTAMNYYLSDAQAAQFAPEIEKLLIEKMQNAPTLGQKITFYRAFVSLASSENARNVLKEMLKSTGGNPTVMEGAVSNSEVKKKTTSSVKPKGNRDRTAPSITVGFPPLKAKDKFDIVTKLITLGDADGLKLLAELEETETGDAAKRYAYAAKAGIATKENKAKYWKDFTDNKEISESYIESAFNVWNTPKHAELTLPYLEKALAELPNLKKNRKIFFVNGWLGVFIGGQKSEEALNIVNKFLADNPKLDKDLRLKILENSDNLERAVKIREKYGK